MNKAERVAQALSGRTPAIGKIVDIKRNPMIHWVCPYCDMASFSTGILPLTLRCDRCENTVVVYNPDKNK